MSKVGIVSVAIGLPEIPTPIARPRRSGNQLLATTVTGTMVELPDPAPINAKAAVSEPNEWHRLASK